MPHDDLARGLDLIGRADSRAAELLSPASDRIARLLDRYVREIQAGNPALSLVGTDDRQEIIQRHILDSLSPLGIIAEKLASAPAGADGRKSIADIGSGAGLPGIPLALAMPEVPFTLIENKGRRAGFLRTMASLLALKNVTVEEQEMEKTRLGPFSLLVFRAFRPLTPEIYRKLARLCRKGGTLAAYKGRREKAEAEIAALQAAIPALEGRWQLLPCPVPDLEEERHLLLIDCPS
ncbi:MAG: 16S rRNA (guanine(527)-N(7))-methyltransferase RsmG [Treponema sp.]|nr:16S rRNA (guanine(527)-N(7))-methyltransferase RsmG [Treponema sp.]